MTRREVVGPVPNERVDGRVGAGLGRVGGRTAAPAVGVEAPGGPQWPRLASGRTLNALPDAPGVQVRPGAGNRGASTRINRTLATLLTLRYATSRCVTHQSLAERCRAGRVTAPRWPRVAAAVRAPRAERRGRTRPPPLDPSRTRRQTRRLPRHPRRLGSRLPPHRRRLAPAPLRRPRRPPGQAPRRTCSARSDDWV